MKNSKLNDFNDFDFLNKIFKSKNCGEFIVLNKTENKKGTNYLFKIKFIKTGYIKDVLSQHIREGSIRDPYFPSVYGIGYVGDGVWKVRNRSEPSREYKLWHGILQRCYDFKFKNRQSTYLDVTVDERWHNFQNFCEDILSIENYNKWKNSKEKLLWAIDKDIKVKGNKIYSKDTCMFVTNVENNLEARITGLSYKAIRLCDGYEEVFYIQTEFAKKYGLNKNCVNGCIKGIYKTHKGWKFTIL